MNNAMMAWRRRTTSYGSSVMRTTNDEKQATKLRDGEKCQREWEKFQSDGNPVRFLASAQLTIGDGKVGLD
jgi:hypothetical protein